MIIKSTYDSCNYQKKTKPDLGPPFKTIFKNRKIVRIVYPSIEQPLFSLKNPRPTYPPPCNHEVHKDDEALKNELYLDQ